MEHKASITDGKIQCFMEEKSLCGKKDCLVFPAEEIYVMTLSVSTRIIPTDHHKPISEVMDWDATHSLPQVLSLPLGTDIVLCKVCIWSAESYGGPPDHSWHELPDLHDIVGALALFCYVHMASLVAHFIYLASLFFS